MDRYVRIHMDVNIDMPGSSAVDGNATYFIDGIHLRLVGYATQASLYVAAGTAA